MSDEIITHAIPFARGDIPTSAAQSKLKWNDRTGDANERIKSSNKMTYIALATAAVLGISNVWQSLQTKIAVFEVDHGRQPDSMTLVNRLEFGKPSDTVISKDLRDWAVGVRSIYQDWNATQKGIRAAYAMTATRSQASQFLDQYYLGSDPYERAKAVYVLTSDMIAQPITFVENANGERTWKVEWKEDTHAVKDNSIISSKWWTATVTYSRQAPRTEEEVHQNPDGILVKFVSWVSN